MAIEETASGPNSVAVTGTATGDKSRGVLGKADGTGVKGEGTGTGVWGHGKTWMGVYGFSESTTGGAGVMGEGKPGPGVIGKSTKWVGVYGETEGVENGPAGVWGEHKGAGTGVKAVSKDGAGLAAYSATNEAIHAETKSPGTAAVAAYNLNLTGTGPAVHAEHKGGGIGALGKSVSGIGIWGVSEKHEGVHAETNSAETAAIAAYNLNPAGRGAAIFAKKLGSEGHAGFFDGDVFVTGDISCHNADCAEDFDIAGGTPVEPGTVLVMSDHGLQESSAPYDKRVVGVVSGAADYRPGLVLDRRESRAGRQPVALLGKVFCKVDASFGGIAVGDLLTSSPTPGHAMKAGDPHNAFGAVIGKALSALDRGQGLIPILVALQ